jgi:hypothetical protein
MKWQFSAACQRIIGPTHQNTYCESVSKLLTRSTCCADYFHRMLSMRALLLFQRITIKTGRAPVCISGFLLCNNVYALLHPLLFNYTFFYMPVEFMQIIYWFWALFTKMWSSKQNRIWKKKNLCSSVHEQRKVQNFLEQHQRIATSISLCVCKSVNFERFLIRICLKNIRFCRSWQ